VLIFRRKLPAHLEDAVDVNLKGDFNLGNTSGCRGNPGEVKLAEKVVVLGHWSLSFKHLDGDGWLVVGGSGEDLRFLGWDDSITYRVELPIEWSYLQSRVNYRVELPTE